LFREVKENLLLISSWSWFKFHLSAGNLTIFQKNSVFQFENKIAKGEKIAGFQASTSSI
jgi:hypothetical protein